MTTDPPAAETPEPPTTEVPDPPAAQAPGAPTVEIASEASPAPTAETVSTEPTAETIPPSPPGSGPDDTPTPGLPRPDAAQPGYPYAWPPAPTYPQAAYPPPGWGYYPPPPPTDTMAILGLVFAFVFAPAGLVLSIVGMRRTKNTPDRTGYTLALVGMILSAIQTAILALVVLAYAGMAVAFLAALAASSL